jgi:integrase/recombinase XerD
MKTSDDRFFRLVRDFLLVYLPKHRCCSPHTVKAYRETLQLFRRFLQEQKHVPFPRMTFDHLDHHIVAEFLQWLRTTRNCGVATCNQRLAALKAFAKYAAQEDVALMAVYTEVSKVRAQRAAHAPISYLSEPALAALLAQPDPAKPRGLRDQCLLVLLYDTAARIQELLDLRLRDVHWQEPVPCVYLTGKRQKTRVVPLLPPTLKHVTRYLERFHPGPAAPDAWLFYTIIKGRTGPLSPDAVARFLRQYAQHARVRCPEVPLRVHPHLLRHTRAMHLYQAGMPLSYIKDFLGHASVNTTDIYAAADVHMLRAALEKTYTDPARREVPIWADDEALLRQLTGLG